MKYYITIFIFLIIMFLTGCSQDKSTQTKEANTSQTKEAKTEVKNEATVKEEDPEMSFEEKQQRVALFFQQDLGNMDEMEVEALQTITTTSSETINHEQHLSVLVNQKLPAYESAVSQIKQLKPELSELKAIKGTVLSANEAYFKALQLQKKAIETQDLKFFEQANEKMNQYLRILEDYHFQVEEITQKYQVELSNGEIAY
ncbi:hypothetical protein [Bacillus marasmi]|uniref:hypothetical protein n=1 Tax=Bacillus marasmi TaxID=1926279 RepID=UPI0011CA9AFC|nr:hypothetical protein [Bacillus marasmi]